jgi:hypothetical protein
LRDRGRIAFFLQLQRSFDFVQIRDESTDLHSFSKQHIHSREPFLGISPDRSSDPLRAHQKHPSIQFSL